MVPCSANTMTDRHVLGDWGTTRLRLFLVEGGKPAASCEGPGIGALREPPADVLARHLRPWSEEEQHLPVVLCGMAGSRNGLAEAPYAATPIDCATWARAATRLRIGTLDIAIACGLRDDTRPGAPDVMRGEETQIFGALRETPALTTGSHVFVLPGTHSKWAEVDGGFIVRFRTALTGELFALLRDHSMLLRAGDQARGSDDDEKAGFETGLERSTQTRQGLLSALFEARTAQLLQQRSAAWARGFLSGLLIDQEISGMIEAYPGIRSVQLVASGQLATLYRRAFERRAIPFRFIDADACALSGLHLIHAAVHQESSP